MKITQIRNFITSIAMCLLSLITFNVNAHDFSTTRANNEQISTVGTVRYLGNEGILVVDGATKILFDPFFHQNFNQYQSVPADIIDAIHQNKPPYDNIAAIFISHAHDDHFTAKTVADYLMRYPTVKLVAPQQAIDKLTPYGDRINKHNLIAVDLAFGDNVWRKNFNDFKIDAIRIPHAGWPGRADVQNIVFRVAFNQGATIIHMGDADANDQHYLPYRSVWQEKQTDTAFPPYWFFYSAEGRDILYEIINANQLIGIHVPIKVPALLTQGTYQYFSKPGSEKPLKLSSVK